MLKKNRVLDAIAKMEIQIGNRIKNGQTTVAAVEKARQDLDLDFATYVRFQELKSWASCDGTLTLEEAMSVWGKLGNTPDFFNAQPVAVKFVLNGLLSELLKKQIGK